MRLHYLVILIIVLFKCNQVYAIELNWQEFFCYTTDKQLVKFKAPLPADMTKQQMESIGNKICLSMDTNWIPEPNPDVTRFEEIDASMLTMLHDAGISNKTVSHNGSPTQGELLQLLKKYPEMTLEGTFITPNTEYAIKAMAMICDDKDLDCRKRNSLDIDTAVVPTGNKHSVDNWFIDMCNQGDSTLTADENGWSCWWD